MGYTSWEFFQHHARVVLGQKWRANCQSLKPLARNSTLVRMHRRKTSLLPVWAFCLSLLLAQTAALSHALKHDLYEHDGPCALHVLADHTGNSLPSYVSPNADFGAHTTTVIVACCTITSDTHTVYAARAPPRVSFL